MIAKPYRLACVAAALPLYMVAVTSTGWLSLLAGIGLLVLVLLLAQDAAMRL